MPDSTETKIDSIILTPESTIKQSFVKDLAPIRGLDAILFIQAFNSIMHKPTTILPCGCIYVEIKNEYQDITLFYISICPTHKLTETFIHKNFIYY